MAGGETPVLKQTGRLLTQSIKSAPKDGFGALIWGNGTLPTVAESLQCEAGRLAVSQTSGAPPQPASPRTYTVEKGSYIVQVLPCGHGLCLRSHECLVPEGGHVASKCVGVRARAGVCVRSEVGGYVTWQSRLGPNWVSLNGCDNVPGTLSR